MSLGVTNLGYTLAYRLRLTPWERSSPGLRAQLATYLDRYESTGGPLGKALDAGCGTGDHSIEMAGRGWHVTGVDAVPLAIERARRKAAAEGVTVTFVLGDVTALGDSVGTGYRFVLDLGCFHGLTPAQRRGYARELSAVTEPGASLLMFAFGPGRRGPLPRGTSRAEVERTLSQWRLSADDAADTSGLPPMLRRSNPRWFRLIRIG
ncbi:class I SAM-dependent methyltransferase [Rhodococcus kronopolitis]|uniref:Class I SAM-dependent methyltransferase n=1 Tax=Rhodococcus kronopolitis TaxID=1460226 RepID=A0ABV9FXL5_9NOCA